MGQKESSTSVETSNAETNETNVVPKERRRSQHLKRNNKDVEVKHLDQSGQTSHKSKERKTEASNSNGRRQFREKSKSVAMDLHTMDMTEQKKDKTKVREVKSLEDISMPGRLLPIFSGKLKNKDKSKTLDQTKQKKKDLEVKFQEGNDQPGLPLVDFDKRRRSRQRKSMSKDNLNSKSLGPTAEAKQKSKARKAKSLDNLVTWGQYASDSDSDELSEGGRRVRDLANKTPQEKAEITIFNTFKALRLINKQLERITKNQECLTTLSRNIQSFKNEIKIIRKTTTERRDKLWEKYEDWQKLIQDFDYPLAHLGAMMNVDMNFLKRLKFLDYVIVSMETLKDNCKKLEQEKETSEAKHQEERKKLLDERVKLEAVLKHLEDMFPSIKRKMKRKEREMHRANKGTQTQSHYEASMTLSNLLSQIHSSFAHFTQNFQHLSL